MNIAIQSGKYYFTAIAITGHKSVNNSPTLAVKSVVVPTVKIESILYK